jgi:hypothetical protein
VSRVCACTVTFRDRRGVQHSSPERVIAFKLDASLTHIVSETIVERSTPTLGDPTHGVIAGDTFYYIANSGWDVIDDHGNMKLEAKPSEARINASASEKALRATKIFSTD